MPNATFSTVVNAPLTTVWALLLDKVEHPERYIGAVQESSIQERYSDGVLREMRTAQMRLLERITIDEPSHTIIFTLVDHPKFVGSIRNTVEVNPQDSGTATSLLTFEIDWQARQSEANNDADNAMIETLKQGLFDTKAQIETHNAAT
jgi:hypothetical protein